MRALKLITPLPLLFTTALLALYAAGATRVWLIERSPLLAIGALLAAVASVGTACMQRWSQYLVHLMTTGFVMKWCWSVYDGWQAGYFGFQFGSMPEALRSLLPGLALVLLSAICSWLVHDHFSRTARAGAQPGPPPGGAG